MPDTPNAYHCRFYENGSGMTMNVNKQLSNVIKSCFKPEHDYSAIYDPKKGTLTIFKPVLPS